VRGPSSLRGAQRRSNPEHKPRTGLLRFARNDEIKFRSRGAMRARGLLYNEANSQSPREKEGSGAPKGASNQCPRRIGLRHHEPMHGARKRALAEARSPSGAPLRHSPRLLPLGSAPGRASWNYRVQTGGPSPAPVQRAPRGQARARPGSRRKPLRAAFHRIDQSGHGHRVLVGFLGPALRRAAIARRLPRETAGRRGRAIQP